MNWSVLKTQWQQLPEATVRRLQGEKLRHYLREVVVPFSAHYREIFKSHGLRPDSIRSVEDLEQIPFTTKADLVNTPANPTKSRDFILIPDQQVLAKRPSTIVKALLRGREHVKLGFELEFRPIFMTSTTGRSADPVPFVFTQHDLDNLASGGDRIMQICGAQKEFRLLNMFPYAPHLAFWLTHYAATAFGLFCLSTGGGKVLGTDGNLRMITKVKPDVLIGMPTFIYHVLQQAVEAGVRIEGLRKIVLGGEKVAEGIRRKLRVLAHKLGSPNIQVLATYGFTESKMAWAECSEGSAHVEDSAHSARAEAQAPGYHLYPDQGIFEVVDPRTGIAQPPGAPGELVYTPLDARGSVVLRYRTGDCIDGGLVYSPCPYCKRTVPRLVGKISRNSEVKAMMLDKIKGTLVDFNQLEHVLDDASNIGAWQLEIRKKNDDPMELDELILHVHKSANVDDQKLCREINNRFIERTEVQPNRIQFHDAEELRRMQGVGVLLKEQKIIDNRPGKAPATPATNGSAQPSMASTAEAAR